jgi:catechol 2,3-dioxygenase-like lactoylglutathione lyase family enzyme
MNQRPTTIAQVATVFVPVSDQERAIAFYAGTLGFEKRGDFTYGGGHRWVEVAPAGSVMALALVPPTEGTSAAPGDAAVCALVSEDIEADHAALRAKGVDVDAEIAREGTSREGLVSLAITVENPVPAQFFFRDPDGNRFLVVQPD